MKEAESWPHLQSEHECKNDLDNSESEDCDTQAGSNKQVLPVNPTPKFVDNKRKKLEKQLSAKQRDMVLMDAAKKEIQLKTTIAHGLLDSNKSINNTIGQMAESINSLGAGLVQGFQSTCTSTISKPATAKLSSAWYSFPTNADGTNVQQSVP